MKLNKTLLVVFSLLIALVIGFAVAACKLDPEEPNQGATAAKNTVKVVPGNFETYDYFADAYGLNAEKAYKFGDSNTAYYYRNYSQRSVHPSNGLADIRVYHPFSTLLYEEFQFLLQSDKAGDLGYYAIVFGGEWEPKTAAVLDAVNQSAAAIAYSKTTAEDKNGKDSFINTIYNFDFKINGGLDIEKRLTGLGFTPHPSDDNTVAKGGYNEYNTDIRTDLTPYGNNDAKRTITNLYKTLYDTFNVPANAGSFISGQTVTVKGGANLDNIQGTYNYIKSPSVLLIKKENVSGAVKNTIVDFIDASGVDFTDAAAVTGFKTAVTALLNKTDNQPLKKFDFFLYTWGSSTLEFTNTFNGKRYNVQYNNLSDTNHIFRTVSYRELIRILESDGHYPIYFGGQWCPFSRGFLAQLNQVGKAYGIREIYLFDPRLDGLNASTMIRDNESSTAAVYQRLYANLISYFGLDYNAYDFPSSHDYLSPKLGIADQDLTIGGKKITKIGVPGFLGYNKDNVDENGERTVIFGKGSWVDTFPNIIAETAEPTKYGVQRETVGGREYWTGVSYVDVARTSALGRRQENNIVRFLDAFYDGKLTYKVKGAK